MLPNEPEETFQRYMTIVKFDIEEKDEIISMVTDRGIFRFKIDDDCISNDDKELMFLNLLSFQALT